MLEENDDNEIHHRNNQALGLGTDGGKDNEANITSKESDIGKQKCRFMRQPGIRTKALR